MNNAVVLAICTGSPNSCGSIFRSNSCFSTSDCRRTLEDCQDDSFCRAAGCGCRYRVGTGTSGRVTCTGSADDCSDHNNDERTCRGSGCRWVDSSPTRRPTRRPTSPSPPTPNRVPSPTPIRTPSIGSPTTSRDDQFYPVNESSSGLSNSETVLVVIGVVLGIAALIGGVVTFIFFRRKSRDASKFNKDNEQTDVQPTEIKIDGVISSQDSSHHPPIPAISVNGDEHKPQGHRHVVEIVETK